MSSSNLSVSRSRASSLPSKSKELPPITTPFKITVDHNKLRRSPSETSVLTLPTTILGTEETGKSGCPSPVYNRSALITRVVLRVLSVIAAAGGIALIFYHGHEFTSAVNYCSEFASSARLFADHYYYLSLGAIGSAIVGSTGVHCFRHYSLAYKEARAYETSDTYTRLTKASEDATKALSPREENSNSLPKTFSVSVRKLHKSSPEQIAAAVADRDKALAIWRAAISQKNPTQDGWHFVENTA